MGDGAVLDLEKVNGAIKGVQSLFVRRELTVPEAIQALRSLDAAYRGQFPELYAIMEGKPRAKGPKKATRA